MNPTLYGTMAYIARYWFAALSLVVLWRAMKWIQKDATLRYRQESRLPDAGFIGEWAVIASDAEKLPVDTIISVPRDGSLGNGRTCDVKLPIRGIPAHAARFILRRDGLHVLPRRGDLIAVDGEPVKRQAILRHGATLQIGGITLQLRLFAGIRLEGETAVPPMKPRTETIPPGTPSKPAAQGMGSTLPTPVLRIKKGKKTNRTPAAGG